MNDKLVNTCLLALELNIGSRIIDKSGRPYYFKKDHKIELAAILNEFKKELLNQYKQEVIDEIFNYFEDRRKKDD